jgi:hypothetical protein
MIPGVLRDEVVDEMSTACLVMGRFQMAPVSGLPDEPAQ